MHLLSYATREMHTSPLCHLPAYIQYVLVNLLLLSLCVSSLTATSISLQTYLADSDLQFIILSFSFEPQNKNKRLPD